MSHLKDNSARIAEIEAILAEGATTVNVDGLTVTYNFSELRTELRRLQKTDTAQAGRRPVLASIDLSNAF